MNVQYRTANGRMMFTIEARDSSNAFEAVAEIQEVFEEPRCGRCGCDQIRFDVREFNGNTHYKIICMQCRGQLDVSQRKDKKIFIKRKDKDGRIYPMHGWYVWDEQTRTENRSVYRKP